MCGYIKMKARANVNFALIKYWGKKDEALKIPYQSSLSFTVDSLYTETTVKFDGALTKDLININGLESDKAQTRVVKHLDYIRNKYHEKRYAYVSSKNFVPTAAGLASSASAFAALTYAAISDLGLNLSEKELSKLARVGSGSASRSIYGGFAIWHHGYDDASSYAEKLKIDWPEFRIIVCLVDENEKKASSTLAMKKSVENTESYNQWVTRSEIDLKMLLSALNEKDIAKVGLIAEANALLMHDLIEETGIIYKTKVSNEIIERVKTLRDKGIEAYITMDAGPNVKIITLEKDVKSILEEFKDLKTIVCKSGNGVELIND